MRRFAYRLALYLGQPNVDHMLRNMTSNQFMEWLMFAELEPFGGDREDARAASIVRTIANANRDPKKVKTPFTIEDCMLAGGDAIEVKAKSSKKDWRAMKAFAMSQADVRLRKR